MKHINKENLAALQGKRMSQMMRQGEHIDNKSTLANKSRITTILCWLKTIKSMNSKVLRSTNTITCLRLTNIKLTGTITGNENKTGKYS